MKYVKNKFTFFLKKKAGIILILWPIPSVMLLFYFTDFQMTRFVLTNVNVISVPSK